MKLLETLVKDEKMNDQVLYSSGPYWDYKNKRTLNEIKKKGIEDFRGLSTGIGTSFADNQVLDIRNELNFKGKIVAKFFSMPFIKKIFQSQINITRDHLKNYLINLAIVYKNNPLVQNLIKKYNFKNTTQFGCISKFKYLEKEYSTHYLDMAYRIENLSEKFDFKKLELSLKLEEDLEPTLIFCSQIFQI